MYSKHSLPLDWEPTQPSFKHALPESSAGMTGTINNSNLAFGRQRPRLIGLYSPVPQSGKSTVARFLSDEYGYVRVSFADPLRELEELFYKLIGATGLYMDDKEAAIENMAGIPNVTRRKVLQTLGTEWGRTCIHPEVWVRAALLKIGELFDAGESVVIDDVRFVNEYTAIRQLGGEVWTVHRPQTEVPPSAKHVSEGALDGYLSDRYLRNDSTVTQLLARAEEALINTSHYVGPTERPLTKGDYSI